MELLSRMQRSGRLPRCIVTGAVFAALWYFLLECLGQYWVVQPEYSFGWLVPILCGFLFWLRLQSRPAPGEPRVGVARVVLAVTALGLLPTWLIVQANPDWRVMAWLLAARRSDYRWQSFIGWRKGLVGSLRIERLSDTDGCAGLVFLRVQSFTH